MAEEKNILKKLLLEILNDHKSENKKKHDKNKKIKISSSSSSEEEVNKITFKKRVHETEEKRN